MSQPGRPRIGRISKELFSGYFKDIPSQPYHEPASGRGPNAHHRLRLIAWNPLSTWVATVTSEKTIRVWNPEKKEHRYSTELRGHVAGIEKIAFNPAKEAELCSISNDGAVKLWDVRAKACVNEIKAPSGAHSLAWAPDGSSLLVGSKDGVLCQISPAKSAVASTRNLGVDTNQMSFCWSGKKVFIPTADGTIRILSYPELEPVLHASYSSKDGGPAEFMLKGHTASCLTTELSPTGKYLATGGADSIIALFDTRDWICQRTISRMVGPVKCLSAAPTPRKPRPLNADSAYRLYF
ncbi:hypothetical protein VTH82DRAFT_2757 [Thermothelomyces myriococcoides]